MLGEAFEETVQLYRDSAPEHEQMSFLWFDFHKECAKMKWENLSKLMKQVEADFDAHGYVPIAMIAEPAMYPRAGATARTSFVAEDQQL